MKLLAIVGGLGSPAAFCLAEEARRVHGARVGRCVLADAAVDATTLIVMMDYFGAKELVLIFACTMCSNDVYLEVEPLNAEAAPENPDIIVRALWPNLTGSLDPKFYIEALRLLYNREFKVYMVKSRGDECRESIQSIVRRECQ